MPPGAVIFEDPPIHDIHRRLLARVFTPRKINALEPKIREFCAQSLDPLVGAGQVRLRRRPRRADADAGDRHAARHPRGRPGGDPRPRQRADAHRGGQAHEGRQTGFVTGEIFADYIDWRAEHPSDDLMTELLNAEFEDETGTTRAADPRGAPHLRQRGRRRGQRDHHAADRLGGQGAGRTPRPAPRARREPGAHSQGDRGAAALRAARAARRPLRRPATSSTTARPCPRAA